MSRWNRGWKNFLAAAGLCAVVAVGVPVISLPAEAATPAVDGVNVRNNPSTDEDNVIGSLSLGDEITILDTQTADDGYTWYYVQLDNGNTGWVRSDLISAEESELPSGSESGESGDTEASESDAVAEEDTQTPDGEDAQTAEEVTTQDASANTTADSTDIAAVTDPTTDPNSSFSTQYLTGDDGVSSWYVVNDNTGERIRISDLGNGGETTTKSSGSGWKAFAIVMTLIAIALAAFSLFLLKSIRDGRSKSTHGRSMTDADNGDDFDEEDTYYFEDDDDEPGDTDAKSQSTAGEDTEENSTDDAGEDGSKDSHYGEPAAVEHVTDAEEIPAGQIPVGESAKEDEDGAVYEEEEEPELSDEEFSYEDEAEEADEEDYEDEYDDEYFEEGETPKKNGFIGFVHKFLGRDSKEDSEEQAFDEDSFAEDEEPEEFDEFKEYPEDIDLLPKEEPEEDSGDDFAEDITFEDEEITEDYHNGRTRLSMQRIMKNVPENYDEDIPEEEFDEDQDTLEDDLFDDEDDDMEYSFLGTRHRK